MDALKRFLELLPVLAQLLPNDHRRMNEILGMVAEGEAEIERRMAASGQSREEVLQDATATWEKDLQAAAELALLGHEQDQQPPSS